VVHAFSGKGGKKIMRGKTTVGRRKERVLRGMGVGGGDNPEAKKKLLTKPQPPRPN